MRDLPPVIIRENRVFRSGPKHDVPHGPLMLFLVRDQRERLVEQHVQPAHIPRPIRPQGRFQRRRRPEPGDHMRVHVLVALPRPEQVADQPINPLAPLHLPDH